MDSSNQKYKSKYKNEYKDLDKTLENTKNKVFELAKKVEEELNDLLIKIEDYNIQKKVAYVF